MQATNHSIPHDVVRGLIAPDLFVCLFCSFVVFVVVWGGGGGVGEERRVFLLLLFCLLFVWGLLGVVCLFVFYSYEMDIMCNHSCLSGQRNMH